MDQGGIQLSGSAGVAISSSTFDYLGFAAGTNAYITARDLTSAATFYNVTFSLSRSSAGYGSVYNVRTEGGDAGLAWHFQGEPATRGPLWGEEYDGEQGASNRILWGDVLAPSVAILQPAGTYLASLPLIYGTAADDVAVASVTVSLSRDSDGQYWNGVTWAAGQAWLDAVVLPSSWTYSNVPAFADGITYTVTARAMDNWGNWSALEPASAFTFDEGPAFAVVTVPAQGADVTSFSGVSGTASDAGSAPGQVWVKVKRIQDDMYWDGALSQWTGPEAWNPAS